MEHASRETRWLRAAAGSLAAIFALPSCFTTALWRVPDRVPTHRFDAVITAPDGGDGTAVQFAVQPPAAAAVRELWQPPLSTDEWLIVRPLAHPTEVARLLADRQRSCELHLLGESAAAPRCWFHCDFDAQRPSPPLDEFETSFGLLITSYAVDVPCTVERSKAPPADASRQTFAIATCGPGSGTPVRIAATPLTLALDVVFLPFELITLPLWL